ncbi:adenosylmethionine--8-amino-7-oxononanoate transaminase [Pedobacter heparinus]|uniref:Adenosylmethionine-8-amino-7-oxononanoate aminotransferase n=1 Tax=Pedobacter heparinus (strain ATCC 13125 / DSM 2366 / CIP 104194 / JCM 7457 / NBRC 12017 / NCIMB 9290 / NRRL B-14731 / HIM 762-3) TaxID=485917 RepID=C6Y058_PEDHD|nr:adenosylmethionine--8-amino-7-oxononanoate transaminase [Pedobacter heparinus]ACU04770.1 adenosylmethionine-8-amino-7-oxononanoate aminotransferase [Pedobacter heparinus DSM 2366]
MSLINRDAQVIWHPYTQMKNHLPHVPIVRGEGVYLFDEKGKKYIDAVSSWWVNIHGHAHPHIAAKVAEQLNTLEHVIFAGFTHEPAVRLAERLLPLLPGVQKKVFYSDNGSTAVEVALKMCLQYWVNTTKEPRTKIIAFKDAYHGDTFGAMSVSGRSIFTEPFSPLLFDVEFVELPNAQNIEQLKSKINYLSNEVACFIFEPMVLGAGGMLMYEAIYLDQLIETCQKHGILTIADEVMTGFGRTGKYFSTEALQTEPDIFCLSKGLTGGTMPLGVTTCNSKIFNAFLSDDKLKTLYHGHSFTANPVACAAALASLDILLQPETLQNIKRIESRHQVFSESIIGHPKLKNVRQNGTILVMEWQTEGDTSYLNGLRDRLYLYFLERGIILRPLGNILYILPPYVISDEDLAYIYQNILTALEEI